jgi:hypothetical protein
MEELSLKQDLCIHVLEVLDIVNPGNNRKRGIGKYGLFDVKIYKQYFRRNCNVGYSTKPGFTIYIQITVSIL